MKLYIFCFVILLFVFPKINFSQISPIVKEHVQQIYNLIKKENIQYPEFVIAQSIAETGWMKCKNCCYDFHNLFGFIGPGKKCLKFESDYQSIQYYKKWQDARIEKWRAKYPNQDYYHFLKYVKYATGDVYNKHLKKYVTWVNKNLVL
jgi:disulfide oxidoreductase YuzD